MSSSVSILCPFLLTSSVSILCPCVKKSENGQSLAKQYLMELGSQTMNEWVFIATDFQTSWNSNPCIYEDEGLMIFSNIWTFRQSCLNNNLKHLARLLSEFYQNYKMQNKYRFMKWTCRKWWLANFCGSICNFNSVLLMTKWSQY